MLLLCPVPTFDADGGLIDVAGAGQLMVSQLLIHVTMSPLQKSSLAQAWVGTGSAIMRFADIG